MTETQSESRRRAPRDIPRDAWPLHPNWPAQVLLVQSHANFRMVSDRLKDAVRQAGSLHGASRLFRRWMHAMSSHEHYEESKLYPYLDRRWGVSMHALVAGHEGLHGQRHEVFAAFDAALSMRDHDARDAVVSPAVVGARDRVRAAVDGFDELLLAHLDLEERTVVPLLLELSPTEFADYTLLPLHRPLAALDGPEDRS